MDKKQVIKRLKELLVIKNEVHIFGRDLLESGRVAFYFDSFGFITVVDDSLTPVALIELESLEKIDIKYCYGFFICFEKDGNRTINLSDSEVVIQKKVKQLILSGVRFTEKIEEGENE